MHRRTGESGFPRRPFPGSFRLMRECPGGALHPLEIFPRAILALQNNSFAFAALALLALGPIALIWIAAYLVQQGRGLAAETRRARALADSLLAPAALAARGAGSAVDAVRVEIQRASA